MRSLNTGEILQILGKNVTEFWDVSLNKETKSFFLHKPAVSVFMMGEKIINSSPPEGSNVLIYCLQKVKSHLFSDKLT